MVRDLVQCNGSMMTPKIAEFVLNLAKEKGAVLVCGLYKTKDFVVSVEVQESKES